MGRKHDLICRIIFSRETNEDGSLKKDDIKQLRRMTVAELIEVSSRERAEREMVS